MLDYSYKNLLKVALPLMLSGFIQSIISITDASFLSRYNVIAYEASGAAGLWYITLYMVFLGLSDAAQIGMSQGIGKKDNSCVSATFKSNFVLLVIGAIALIFVVNFIIPSILDEFVTNPVLAKQQNSFLSIRGYAFFAATVTLSIQSYLLAVGKTRIVLYASILVAFSNIILDYYMVFGIGWFTEMGLTGAAWASTIAEILGASYLLIYFLLSKEAEKWQLFSASKVTWNSIKENLSLALPLIFQGLIALSIWTVFFMWIEQMGKNNLSVSLNIRYIYFLAFVPIWGFAGAAKTFIAQYFGAKEYSVIPIIQRRIQLLTIFFLVVTFHGALFYPEVLIRMVSENETDIHTSAQILRLVFGSIIIYAIGSVYFQTVSAIGKTRITLVIEMCSTFLYILSAFLFIKVWNWEIVYVWIVEYIYFITMGSIAFLYIKRNHKKLTGLKHE